jgi:hypothetical protein
MTLFSSLMRERGRTRTQKSLSSQLNQQSQKPAILLKPRFLLIFP